ncbi:hypothetical protein E2C01_022755 [Portunus trituberculatus]|uniref:Uncharacterized protein n=1 Tax=Portunus trituberculatus TaxID=210409 RepID=A0A5B7E8G6_PORTR|nr:hypothetical protein [Portunus trituberculatus]
MKEPLPAAQTSCQLEPKAARAPLTALPGRPACRTLPLTTNEVESQPSITGNTGHVSAGPAITTHNTSHHGHHHCTPRHTHAHTTHTPSTTSPQHPWHTHPPPDTY